MHTKTRPVVSFAAFLKSVRADRGWSQRAAARRFDISPTQLKRYEAGEQQPTLPILVRIADELGVSVDEVCGRPRPAARPREIRLSVDGEVWSARPAPSAAPVEPQTVRAALEQMLQRVPDA